MRETVGVRVWIETRRKARLLAAQRDVSLAEAIDAAISTALTKEEYNANFEAQQV